MSPIPRNPKTFLFSSNRKSPIDLMAKASKKPIRFGNRVVKLLEKIGKIPNSAKEVFLFDIIRLASGDLYRYRLKCLDEQKIKYTEDSEFVIRIEADTDNNTLSITHKGNGWTKEDLMEGIGCISKDMVNNYLDTIDKFLMNGDPKHYYSARLSCEFILGVYSAFMVADRVVITTTTTTTKPYKIKKGNNSAKPIRDQYVWDASASDGFFRLTRVDPKAEDQLMKRGTKVTLYLKNEYITYLDESKLRELVDKYTFDVCPYPICVSVDGHEREIKRRKGEDLETLKIVFEGLQEVCAQALGSRVKKVVVNDRVFDLPCHLLSDSRTFVINPRSPNMRSLLVDFNKNPDSKRKRKKVMKAFLLNYLLFSSLDDESVDDDDEIIDGDDDDESTDTDSDADVAC